MLIALYVFIFLASCFLLGFSSKWLIGALSRIALFFKIKEFVIAFFLMAFATTIPNLIVGIISALHKIPELSFGDVIGGNIVDLSLVLGLGVLLSKAGIPAESRVVQKSSIFTIFIAIFPLLLILDGNLSRVDGFLLLLSFFCYIFWIFSKRERFTKVYNDLTEPLNLKRFFKDFSIIIIGITLLLAGAQGIIKSASFFSAAFGLPLSLIGLLIVGLGNCLPETFFVIRAAQKQESWMILGNLMGSVIMCATLVLGIVSLISPITITNFSPFAVARIFMVISILFFLLYVKTGKKISKNEGIFLIGIYVLYLLAEIFMRYLS